MIINLGCASVDNHISLDDTRILDEGLTFYIVTGCYGIGHTSVRVLYVKFSWGLIKIVFVYI